MIAKFSNRVRISANLQEAKASKKIVFIFRAVNMSVPQNVWSLNNQRLLPEPRLGGKTY